MPHAQKAAIIESTCQSVKYNHIWRNVIEIKLKQNMRTADEKEFANWLMQLGDVNCTVQMDYISIQLKYLKIL